MPYTFTSWTACTDPAGNARALDWSEAGMKGQPPGIYLEALRQGAAQRKAVEGGSTPTRTPPPEWSPSHGIVALDALLEYVDATVWALSTSTSVGWLARSTVVDIDGETDLTGAWPAPITTEAALLTAAGHTARIARPTSFVGVFPGAYLRQLYDVLKAKSVYQTYADQTAASGLFAGRSGEDSSAPFEWSTIEADYAADSWVDEATSQTGAPWLRIFIGDTSASATRRARRVRWIVNGSGGCQHTTAYLYAMAFGGAFHNPDYAYLPENTWGKHLDDVALADNVGDYVCRIDNAGTAPVSFPDPSSAGGYYIKGMLSLCDYRDDFTLGI